MAAEGDGADLVVPPTIQALLAARIDQLEPAERGVLARGSVEGQVFHLGAVQALAPEEPELRRRALTALVRKELVRPEPSTAARRGRLPLPAPADPRRGLRRAAKATRAELHERFADWLDEHGSRPRRARRDRRLPPRAGASLPDRARPGRRAPRAALAGRAAERLARRRPDGARAARRRAAAHALLGARGSARCRPTSSDAPGPARRSRRGAVRHRRDRWPRSRGRRRGDPHRREPSETTARRASARLRRLEHPGHDRSPIAAPGSIGGRSRR